VCYTLSWFSSIKTYVSKTYKKADAAVGGVLPGGVAPSSSTTTSSTPSTTTSSSGGSYQGPTRPSTDVKTFRSTGVSTPTTTPGSGGSSQYQGPTRPSTDVGTFRTTGISTPTTTGGGIKPTSPTPSISSTPSGKIQPAPKSISLPPSYNPNVPTQERYDRSVSSALRSSASNIFKKRSTIGTQGIDAYTQAVIYDPFEYVGKPKAYSKEPGENINLQTWSGTEFGFGLSEEEKELARPEGFKKEPITYYQRGEKEKAKLWGKAGVVYTGEPTEVLGTRISEDIYKKAGSSYTPEKAEIEFKARTTGLNKDIQKVAQTQSKIWEPPAYPIIRTTGRVIETGAIIGATAFGGSGVTLLASGYMGAKTTKESMTYVARFDELSTKQKVLGGAGIAVGTAATVFTFNLGVKKFYNEWRGLIYSDLAKSRGSIVGKETVLKSDSARYRTVLGKKSGSATSYTFQTTETYKTGASKIGFFGKGKTYTKIFDPQTEKWIRTSSSYTTSGNIPSLSSKRILTVGTKTGERELQGYTTGVGKSIITSKQGLKQTQFIAASKPEKEFYRVASTRGVTSSPRPNIKLSYSRGDNLLKIKASSPFSTTRGTIDSTGKIYRISSSPGEIGTKIYSPSGTVTKMPLKVTFGGTSAALAQATTKAASSFNIAKIGASTKTIGATATMAAATKQATPKISYISTTKVTPSIIKKSPTQALISIQKPASRESSRSFSKSVSAFALPSKQKPAVVPAVKTTPIQALIPVSIVGQGQRLGLKTTTSNTMYPPAFSGSYDFGGVFAPGKTTPKVPPFIFNLTGTPGKANLGTAFKGAVRKTSYTPSFSAFVFKKTGKYKPSEISKAGLDFRPITKKFRIKNRLKL